MARFDDDLWCSFRLAQTRAKERKRWASRTNANPARREARGVRNDAKPFIAIDSEGGAHGLPYILDDGRTVQPHKSFLWGASDAAGDVDWLYTGKPLTSIEMIEFLLAQKRRNPTGIFISFAFGYDVGQLVAGFPYEKAWELQRGKAWADRNDPDVKANNTREVYWRDYRFQYIKGKWLTIYKGFGKGVPFVKIYDCFGFFQCSFVKAASEIPGAASKAEMDTIKAGKAKRGDFDHAQIDEMKAYTLSELKVLCRMMDALREKFLGQEIRLDAWTGAGSIARALAKRENVKPHLGETKAENIEEWQLWAHHAFAGGRAELLQQGVSREALCVYDIASAYPAELSALSSMEGGTFARGSCEPDDIRQMDGLSIIRMKARFPSELRFYPLFYRTFQGRIYFPQEVYGTYMQAEAVAAFDFAAQFGGEITIEGVWEFIPGSKVKPFDFIRGLFAYRAKLVALHKAGGNYDLAEKCLKLGMNSCYGKLAQAVGTFGKPPTLACPWFAAAITAGARARMLRAAMHDPRAIVMYATDGIVSQRPLPVEVPDAKTLGSWECSQKPLGGVFVHSGIYSYFGSTSGKTRGFRPDDVTGSTTEIIQKTIPEKWKRGEPTFAFTIKLYATLGLSIITPEAWERCGSWLTGPRELKLNSAGAKRTLDLTHKEMRARSRRLMPTEPNTLAVLFLVEDETGLPLSAISMPDWLDVDLGEAVEDDIEQSEIECGFLPY